MVSKSKEEVINILSNVMCTPEHAHPGTYEQWDNYNELIPDCINTDDTDDNIIHEISISKRIITFKYSAKYLILFAEDSDGDQGCDSRSKFNTNNLNCLIGKRITDIALENTIEDENGPYEITKTNKYTITLADNSKTELILETQSNGFYNGTLELYYCN